VAEPETKSQERPQLPTFATKEELVAHVATLVRNRIAGDLALAVTDYFIEAGVVAAAAQGQASLRATPLDLHRALASFARSRQCPPILRYIIPGLHGELFAEPPQHRMADRREIYDQLEAEHAQHLASLAGFGDRAQEVCRSIEVCVFMLRPDPADYPRPSPIAAALRIRAALEKDLLRLGEQSASMSDVEKLTAFGERLSKLWWKHAHCKNDGDLSAYRARGQPPTAGPPSPVAEQLRAWEREASRQWREAHSVMWSELVLPLVQSCRDVGELAQKHRVGEDLVTLTVTAHRELVQCAIVGPNEAALKALASIEAGMDLLRVRVATRANPSTDDAVAGTPATNESWVPAKLLDEPARAESVKPRETPPRMAFDYTGTSEGSVLSVVRAVRDWRTKWPETVPKKYQIKGEAGKSGGAGDEAIDFALENRLITPDYKLTDLGVRFLQERT